MNIAFLGSFFEKSHTEKIWANSKGLMTVSADTFQQALLDGFEKIGITNMSLVTLPSVGSFPVRYRKLWVEGYEFDYCGRKCVSGGFLNLPQIKQFGIYLSAHQHLLRWAIENDGLKIIIVYALFASYLKAAVEVKRKYPGTQIYVIVLDLPEYFDDKTSMLRSYLKKREEVSLAKLLIEVDAYVLLTRGMVDKLQISNKPYMIMEGIFSIANSGVGTVKKETLKTILYTGKLDNRFGINELLEAFDSIRGDDYRLWICGDGAARINVESFVKHNNRIVYFGNVKREEVLRMQCQATILINPRRADEEYTKYSFPSKTMEYMASGTPTLMYSLPGMPSEYLKFIVTIKGDSVEDLKNTIIDWCEKPKDELIKFGQRAKQFILENKNSINQAQRLIEFIAQNQ